MTVVLAATKLATDPQRYSDRVQVFTDHHGRRPDHRTPLRDWLACFPHISHWLRLARHLGRPGRVLALSVAIGAARRTIAAEGGEHPTAQQAIDTAATVLACYQRGALPSTEMRRRARAAAVAVVEQTTADRIAARVARAAAERNAWTAIDAAYTAAHAAADAAYYRQVGEETRCACADAERADQSADFLAALNRLEGE